MEGTAAESSRAQPGERAVPWGQEERGTLQTDQNAKGKINRATAPERKLDKWSNAKQKLEIAHPLRRPGGSKQAGAEGPPMQPSQSMVLDLA